MKLRAIQLSTIKAALKNMLTVGRPSLVKRIPMKTTQQKKQPEPKPKSSIRITSYWDQDQNPVDFITDIRNWLDLSGIPNLIHIRVSRDPAMFLDIHQTTIEFNHTADLAIFKLGYVFTEPVDIQYF